MSGIALGRRADLAAVTGALAVVTAGAWTLAVRLSAGMSMPAEMGMASEVMAMPAGNLVLVPAMWAAMMVGMMVPSATPMVLAYTAWTRRGPAEGRAARVAAFLSGYVLVWLAFSVSAASLQLGLERVGLLDPGGTASARVGGVVLVLAGAFQLSRLKDACLGRCRTPLGFLLAEWRDGTPGALVMGLRHGVYCLGCCWALMAVLFVVGTMHLGWMAVLAAFVLLEKIAPAVLRVRYLSAVALVGWGALTIAAAGS